MTRIGLASLCLAVGACVIHAGPQPNEFIPAFSGTGITATLAVADRGIIGELLEVRDNSVVVLTTGRVVLVPFTNIAHGTFAHTDVTITNGVFPTSDDMTEVRMLSRFPYGIPPDALRRLLASRQQDSLAVIQP